MTPATAKRALSLASLFLLAVVSAHAQTITLDTNVESALYDTGKRIVVYATAEGIEADIIRVKAWKNNDELMLDADVPIAEGRFIAFETELAEPSSLIVETSSDETKDTIGAVVDPLELDPGFKRPKDFDRYWKKQKKLLAKMPYEVTMDPIELDPADADYLAFDVEINSPGPRPARAVFAKPANAAKGSLPIVLNLHAAGVKGDWCRAHLSEALELAKSGSGALSFDLNAHGMLNHEPESYYEELENGPLKQYWEIGIESRDEYYFRFMYLRMLRSIEWLTRQPEWDGKRILVIGESQGGGQALAAAGLDSRVTAAVATVPAMCDFGALLVGRKGGWPQPVDWHPDSEKVRETVVYFDAAHLLKASKAELVVEIGFTDKTCPSTSIYAAVNQSKGDKTILAVPYRSHGWPEGADREVWEQTVHAAKLAFIQDYLK